MSAITNTNQNTVELNQEKIAQIQKHFFPAGTKINKTEMEYCLSVAIKYGLDPFLRQVFFVPRRAKVTKDGKDVWIDKIEPLVGRDGFLAIAHKSGKFGGIKSYSEIKNCPKLVNNQWQYTQDLVAICEVYRTDSDKPFIVEVAYSEYVQKTNENKITTFWASKPDTMLKKVAESQALRKAFNVSGLYSAEEMGIGITEDEIIIDTEAVQNTTISDEENSVSLEYLTDSVKLLGLDVEVIGEYVRIVGNTYGLTEKLKQLGFKYKSDKKIWWQKINN
ncbi:putative prophage LambdaCh01, recombination protein Bet [Campylobacter insulaenigrae]|uniref:phage recombination protein Bet n=1 Tax=Campylobacter insulaenigrae TaxID=260714 RepID=UPI000F6E7DEB|nr:phage recombination protein Bet [Campylobacter insulaenigrae]MCR6574325.1 phage recombination protein Bet [Campylobacter insulaenigrae]MCR6590520.1 phage recombination protein Bet [Campylobacter insulaenigrae]MCR6592057.1 phage recombination protein Bet [Campylobacter insulaenigrae]VEJ53351.1 putative prophage LambdaCh01, recombination protein Bet [Campylobacter insulaenigrae]